MPNDESEAKAKAMMTVQGSVGSSEMPPAAVSTAAWPREGSILAFIAGNCATSEPDDGSDITGVPEEPCGKFVPGETKKIG